MTNWAPLDVAVGLAVVYFILSLLASTINEGIATFLGLRAKTLETWLVSVLDDKTPQFLGHPLIDPSTQKGKRGPSYIATEVFSAAVLTMDGAHELPKTVNAAIERLPSQKLKDVAHALEASGAHDVAELRAELERWYDSAMERVSGWYKRRVQLYLALIGLVLAILVNADTMSIVSSMWSDKTVRAAVVAEAGRVQKGDLSHAADQVKAIRSLEVPLGWKLSKGDPRDLPHSTHSWLSKVIGVILTALALTLGAPFWFDLLSKIARVRFTGPRPPARTA
jgi:hypothetical protein